MLRNTLTYQVNFAPCSYWLFVRDKRSMLQWWELQQLTAFYLLPCWLSENFHLFLFLLPLCLEVAHFFLLLFKKLKTEIGVWCVRDCCFSSVTVQVLKSEIEFWGKRVSWLKHEYFVRYEHQITEEGMFEERFVLFLRNESPFWTPGTIWHEVLKRKSDVAHFFAGCRA